MGALTLELPSEVLQRLQQEATRTGQPVETLAVTLLTEQMQVPVRHPKVEPAPPGERERIRASLRAAGLLTELGPELKQRAERSTATLEEVEAAFARAGGKPLSEIIDEMRGPKP